MHESYKGFRIQKLISEAGIVSRREAEKLILEKKVMVNGEVALLGQKASFKDEILVDGIPILRQEKVYYLINKPEKTICTNKDPQNRQLVLSLIKDPRLLHTVGRLDYNTTGTLLVTNDNELTYRLTHPSYEIKRVYRARLNEPLTEQEIRFLNSKNVVINDQKSLQKVQQVDKKSYVITLHVGTYHHVKKLFELVGKRVQGLTRLEFAGISHVGKLAKGQYRSLNPKEIRWLKQLTKMER
ncbi:pseudouridine synthase [Candidatus Mycoplasma pogonae]